MRPARRTPYACRGATSEALEANRSSAASQRGDRPTSGEIISILNHFCKSGQVIRNLDDHAHRSVLLSLPPSERRFLPYACVVGALPKRASDLVPIGAPCRGRHFARWLCWHIDAKQAGVETRAYSVRDGVCRGTFLSATRCVRFDRCGERTPITTLAELSPRGARGLSRANPEPLR